ncbi:response regulator [Arcobacter sp. YIC-464]|uniref:response regulator n=1 Tax=Arcobacter sp. YIC-464 TaxID=3376631 RepID=UPI003C2366CF
MINEQMLKDITVLYVEDDHAIQQNTIVTLELVNATIISAVDGKDGVEKFKENQDKIDIIVTDLSMPNMDGLEMIEEIKKIDRDVPVLITTAHQDISYLKKAIELGVTSYIIKPIDIRNIIRSISKAIEPVNEKKELLKKIKTLKEENESLKKQLEEKLST